MPINIGERLRPFSHQPGTVFPVPFTDQGVALYPTAIRVEPSGELIHLDVEGPIDDFTGVLDLERGEVRIFGKGKSSPFCYWICADGDNIFCSKAKPVVKTPPLPIERLSLGMSKKLDVDLLKRRNLLSELLPIWFRLGQMVPSGLIPEGDSLFQDLKDGMLEESRPDLLAHFQALLAAGFIGCFYPQTIDRNFLGYGKSPLPQGTPPHLLLSQGYALIRSLVLKVSEPVCYFLPRISSLFHSGRVLGLNLPFGSVDLEWTHYRLRRLQFTCRESGSWHFQFPKEFQTCRLTIDRSIEKYACTSERVLDLVVGSQYFFDRFEQ